MNSYWIDWIFHQLDKLTHKLIIYILNHHLLSTGADIPVTNDFQTDNMFNNQLGVYVENLYKVCDTDSHA